MDISAANNALAPLPFESDTVSWGANGSNIAAKKSVKHGLGKKRGLSIRSGSYK